MEVKEQTVINILHLGMIPEDWKILMKKMNMNIQLIVKKNSMLKKLIVNLNLMIKFPLKIEERQIYTKKDRECLRDTMIEIV